LQEAYREFHGTQPPTAPKGGDLLSKIAQAAFPREEPLIGG